MALGPIFIFDDTGVDLDVQPDIASAQGCVEIFDIDDLTFIAADGTILTARAEGYAVRLEPSGTKNPAELKSRLRACLSHPSWDMNPALADDPVRAAEVLAARPGRPAHWFKRRRRGV